MWVAANAIVRVQPLCSRSEVTSMLTFGLIAALGIDVDTIPRWNSGPYPGVVTPSSTCGLTSWPLFLAQCTTPLAPGAVDLRGLWSDAHTGGTHVQRIEQCGDRATISGPGVNGFYFVHDFVHADGSWVNGADDYSPSAFPNCVTLPRTPNGGVRGIWNDTSGCLYMNAAPTAAALSTPGILAASRCLQSNAGIEELHFINIGFGLDLMLRRDSNPPAPPPAPRASLCLIDGCEEEEAGRVAARVIIGVVLGMVVLGGLGAGAVVVVRKALAPSTKA